MWTREAKRVRTRERALGLDSGAGAVGQEGCLVGSRRKLALHDSAAPAARQANMVDRVQLSLIDGQAISRKKKRKCMPRLRRERRDPLDTPATISLPRGHQLEPRRALQGRQAGPSV